MSTKGIPIVRPSFYNFPDDKEALKIGDQYMVGDNIMVAPILENGKNFRSIYFPKGRWINYLTNEIIEGKDDVIRIVRLYMSRWRVEEYFRFKKQHFGFENFRVRNLTSINNLNQLLTYAIGLIGLLAEKKSKNQLPNQLIHNARVLRKDVSFYYYQLAEFPNNHRRIQYP